AANIVPIMDRGRRKFTLPCQHYRDGRCVIYERWRPHMCGAYECKLLKQYARGMLSHEQARVIIQQTLLHRAEVRAQMLALGGTAEQGLRELYRTVKNGAGDSSSPATAKLRARVFLNYVALQVQLNRYFREMKPVKTTV